MEFYCAENDNKIPCAVGLFTNRYQLTAVLLKPRPKPPTFARVGDLGRRGCVSYFCTGLLNSNKKSPEVSL